MTIGWRAMAANGWASAASADWHRASACGGLSRQSSQSRGSSILSSRTEVVYGLHTVRSLLQRHPERVLRVSLQHGRSDSRAAQIEQLAHAAGRPVERIDAGRLSARLGDVAHQGVAAEVLPLVPWREQ